MLKMIRCDKFMENGHIRPPIVFHKGLNTILGSNTGSNSIGKSTFLMILDFVFGGDDYIEKSTDIHESIGEHTIEWQFIFNDINYFYSRSTKEYTKVNICNSSFETLKVISVDTYCEILSKEYQLDLPGLTLRNAVGRFIRVFGRDTTNENKPLRNAVKEKEKNEIEGLIKLCGRYSEIEKLSKETDEAKGKERTFKNANNYSYLRMAKNKKEYKSNVMQIEQLEKNKEELIRKSEQGLLDLSSLQSEEIEKLKNELSIYKRQRTRLLSKIRNYEIDNNFFKPSFERNFGELLEFFPNCNLKKIDEIEAFHTKLTSVLNKEISENKNNIQSMIESLNEKISEVEKRISEVNKIPNISIAILKEYSSVQKDLQILQDSNNNYNTLNELTKNRKDLVESLNSTIIKVSENVQNDLNNTMNKLNNYIYDGKRTSPIIEIIDATHYNFKTPLDNGTGTKNRGLVIFDLSMLELTNLPIVVHDSIILKHIEDYAIEKILELYSRSEKQIFIALDKETSYSNISQKILNDNNVLRLQANGGELFGYSWNKIENNAQKE